MTTTVRARPPRHLAPATNTAVGDLGPAVPRNLGFEGREPLADDLTGRVDNLVPRRGARSLGPGQVKR